jgi:hypothetical protein
VSFVESVDGVSKITTYITVFWNDDWSYAEKEFHFNRKQDAFQCALLDSRYAQIIERTTVVLNDATKFFNIHDKDELAFEKRVKAHYQKHGHPNVINEVKKWRFIGNIEGGMDVVEY